MTGFVDPRSPMPRLGLGTWHLGERPDRRAAEADALRAGLDLGMRLIDTAEMYADGGAEEVVGEALRGRRGDAFVVSKFYPHHASRRELPAACARSLERLAIERLDLYLLHWPGPVPLAETVEGLEALVAAGRIARWGVSNFDVAQMEALFAVPGGARCAANQVLYNLARRGIEFDLLPWCRAHGVDVMAYSPFDEGPLLRHKALARIARGAGIAPAQLALAWLLASGVAAIPKAAAPAHLRENAAAREVTLEPSVLAALDAAFPPPDSKRALEII